MAVSLRLGLRLSEHHSCRCGTFVDSFGLHSSACKQASRRAASRRNLSDIISRAFRSAQIPVSKEPTASSRNVGKRPDAPTLIPWHKGKPLTWDVTHMLIPVHEVLVKLRRVYRFKKSGKILLLAIFLSFPAEGP